MSPLPLRHALRYDPVFLELGRRLAGGEFGPPTGVSSSSVLPSPEDVSEIVAFWVLLLGVPSFSSLRIDPAASLYRAIFAYSGFGLTADLVVVGSGSLPYGPTLTGSASCARAFFDFRFGSERLLSYAPDEDSHVPVALPEGDGAFYRAMDLKVPADRRLVPEEADAAALAFARDLLARGS